MLSVSSDYAEGVREAIASGGCNASRATFGAGCLAALSSQDDLPKEWTLKYTHYPRAVEMTKALVALRHPSSI